MKQIYLDYNATTPIHPEVAEAMKPCLGELFGNPSSAHFYGLDAKEAVERARGQVASLLGCNPDEVVFTSGGSESNNYAIKGTALSLKGRGNHIITSSVEHPAVTEVCRFLESQDFVVTYLPVDEYGMVSPGDLEAAIDPRTILVTVMHANNEVGTIEPIEELGSIARSSGVLMHVDAAQSVGKIPTRVDDLGVDMLSIAGHKLYAPKGVGALYVRRGVELVPLVHGAGHESGRRAGTENLLEVVGLGAACAVAERDLDENQSHMRATRDRLHQGIVEGVPEVRLNGHPEKRLPNTLSLGFPNMDAGTLLSELEEVAASAGAACHPGGVEVSPVLKAMGVPLECAGGTVRFSTGHMTTEEEVDQAATAVARAVNALRAG